MFVFVCVCFIHSPIKQNVARKGYCASAWRSRVHRHKTQKQKSPRTSPMVGAPTQRPLDGGAHVAPGHVSSKVLLKDGNKRRGNHRTRTESMSIVIGLQAFVINLFEGRKYATQQPSGKN